MNGDDFDQLIAELNELQNEAMEQREEHNEISKEMYFLGKDVGIARAKQAIRELVEVERES